MAWVADEAVFFGEFCDGLAAGSAGLAGGLVEVLDGDGGDSDVRAEEGDGVGDGVLLGAGGEPEGGVFDVAASDGLAGGEENGCSDEEFAVGRVCVAGDVGGRGLQGIELS